MLFNDFRPGLLKGDSVVDLGAIVSPFGAQTGQAAMEAIISHIDDLRDQLSSLEQDTHRFKSPQELRRVLNNLGITPDKAIFAY